MYTDIRIHELTLGYAERERNEQARMRELHRLARAARGSAGAELIGRIGTLLIRTGEALRRRSGGDRHSERQATLSQART